MLHHSSLIGIFYIWESMRSTLISYQQTVTLREVTRIIRTFKHLHQSAVTVLASTGRYTFADNFASSIAADMYHLRSCIRLLEIIGHSHGIELR